ncbi:prepilin-type N-terminal cleavage/methylation domain-containing protein [Psychrobacillus sp. FSL K6-2836]|uniref:type IV pilus modification PilV family protein n=1 Tax=Psychrobacillus sp. FSL K6-2836 TaxID=2921548 RepID=UPI0030F7AEA4
MKNLNQRGLSLIEILAAVVLLMIIIVGFLSFFAQATSHSRITEDKLTAINLAEKVLVEIKRDPTMVIEDKYPEGMKLNGKTYYPIITYLKEQTNGEFALELKRVRVEIYKENINLSNQIPLTKLYSYQ